MENAVTKMKKATLAVLHHEVKLPDSERHKYCPDGDDTWCQFKKAEEMENKDYHLDPFGFGNFVHR